MCLRIGRPGDVGKQRSLKCQLDADLTDSQRGGNYHPIGAGFAPVTVQGDTQQGVQHTGKSTVTLQRPQRGGQQYIHCDDTRNNTAYE